MITVDLLHNLFCIQSDATAADFRTAFGPMGDHIWAKFVRCDFCLLRLYGQLDEHNSQLLADWLNQRSQVLAEVLR